MNNAPWFARMALADVRRRVLGMRLAGLNGPRHAQALDWEAGYALGKLMALGVEGRIDRITWLSYQNEIWFLMRQHTQGNGR